MRFPFIRREFNGNLTDTYKKALQTGKSLRRGPGGELEGWIRLPGNLESR